MSEQIANRLKIWNKCLRETYNLLCLSIRAEYEQDSEHAHNISLSNKPLRGISISLGGKPKDNDEVQRLRSIYTEFEDKKIDGLRFGSREDLRATSQYLKMMAIVMFCQILNRGDELSDIVKSNNECFFKKHFPLLISHSLITEDEKITLNELIETIKSARNKMIAHADAGKFYIDSTQSWTHQKSLRGIDFEFFRRMVGLLEMAAQIYGHSIKESALQNPVNPHECL